jgi:glycosyltransferase involved in cell wall biosynthesis
MAAAMKRIVLSGVNLVEMGPLAIFRDALRELAEYVSGRYQIVALVHRRQLFSVSGVHYIEFPTVRKSWINRVRFEFCDLLMISRRLRADLWLSMHDITPNVHAKARAVYCHNASPFYSLRFHEIARSGRFAAFTLLYGILYRINIRKNAAVIVQQDWIRREFVRRYAPRQVIVAHPIPLCNEFSLADPEPNEVRRCFTYFYPAYPRPFKNFEVLLDAVALIEQTTDKEFQVWLTFDETTNSYAREIVNKYRSLRSVRWIGILDRNQVLERYRHTDCLVFPSKLETWGLPISEFKRSNRPMIVADLPYASETVGTYEKVAFFKHDDPVGLSELMVGALHGDNVFTSVEAPMINGPFAHDWRGLWPLLFSVAGISPEAQDTDIDSSGTFREGI